MTVLYSHSRMIPRFITVPIILVITTVPIILVIIIIITRPKLARPCGRLASRLRRSAQLERIRSAHFSRHFIIIHIITITIVLILIIFSGGSWLSNLPGLPSANASQRLYQGKL